MTIKRIQPGKNDCDRFKENKTGTEINEMEKTEKNLETRNSNNFSHNLKLFA